MYKNLSYQSGVALIAIMVFLVLIALSVLLYRLNQYDFSLQRQLRTSESLAQAKDALLGYGASYYDKYQSYGFLPCPDVDNHSAYPEGAAHGNCDSKNLPSLGRLPWRTLGLPPLRDGHGECLWYAVSGRYKNATTATARNTMLNEKQKGFFTVYSRTGTSTAQALTAVDDVVAVIIAANARHSDQDRSPESTGIEQCGGNYTAEAYLDEDSQSGIKNSDLIVAVDATNDFIISNSNDGILNDQVLYITREELFRLIYKRTDFADNIRLLSQCISNYVTKNPLFLNDGDFSNDDKRFPWAASGALTTEDNAAYDDQSNTLIGRLPHSVLHSNVHTNNPENNLLVNCVHPEAFTLWQHWKNTLTYEISSAYRPNNHTIPTPICDNTDGNINTNCIEINGGYYAATITMTRDLPPFSSIRFCIDETLQVNQCT